MRAKAIGLAAGLAAVATIGQAGQETQRIELVCAQEAQAECSALHSALRQKTPKADISTLSLPIDHTVGAALRVHLHIVRRASDFVIARLDWEGGAPTKDTTTDLMTGPEVEVATSDTTLNDTALRQLAQGLLQVSPLPL